jgi:hypothetical protein
VRDFQYGNQLRTGEGIPVWPSTWNKQGSPFGVVGPKLFFFGSASGFGINFGSGVDLLMKNILDFTLLVLKD